MRENCKIRFIITTPRTALSPPGEIPARRIAGQLSTALPPVLLSPRNRELSSFKYGSRRAPHPDQSRLKMGAHENSARNN